MAVYEVYSQAELRRYRTHICSKATFVQIFLVAMTILSPLLIAYRSQGKTGSMVNIFQPFTTFESCQQVCPTCQNLISLQHCMNITFI